MPGSSWAPWDYSFYQRTSVQPTYNIDKQDHVLVDERHEHPEARRSPAICFPNAPWIIAAN
jgi:hypothetical protein